MTLINGALHPKISSCHPHPHPQGRKLSSNMELLLLCYSYKFLIPNFGVKKDYCTTTFFEKKERTGKYFTGVISIFTVFPHDSEIKRFTFNILQITRT